MQNLRIPLILFQRLCGKVNDRMGIKSVIITAETIRLLTFQPYDHSDIVTETVRGFVTHL